ncbi:MAG: hypothetical protein WCK16_01525 [Candidatus Moraniibacteriota bacterium]
MLEKLEGLSPAQLAEIAKLANMKLIEKVGKKPAKQMLKNNSSVDSRFRTENEADKEAFESLEKQGVISYSPEDLMLVDIEKLKELASLPVKEKETFKKSLGPAYRYDIFGGTNFSKTLVFLFENKKVISKEDYANGEREEKDLFYLPKNKEEALDIEKIQNSQFYLLLSDLVKIKKFDDADFGKIPSSKKDPKNGLDYREALLAVLIYHPKYGAGYRDEKDGKLYIKRNDRGMEYGKISAEYILKTYSPMGHPTKSKGGSLHHGRAFMQNVLPNLISSELLLPGDFGFNMGSIISEGRFLFDKVIGKYGDTTFNGVSHITGRKNKGNIVCQIEPNLGLIMGKFENEKKKVISVFNIFEKEDVEKTVSGYPVAGIKKTNPVDLERFSQKQKNESEEEFRERIKKGNPVEFLMGEENFEEYLRVREKISKEADFNLNKLPIEKQKSIVELMQEFKDGENEARFLEFIKEYKGDGLKTILALGTDQLRQEEILKIGEIDPKLAWPIFLKFNKIVDLIKNIKSEMEHFLQGHSQYSKEQVEKTLLNYLKTVNDFVHEFSELSKMKKADIWKHREVDIIRRIDSFSEDVVLWAEIFHVMRKEQILNEDIGIAVSPSNVSGAKEKLKEHMQKNLEFFSGQRDVLAGTEIEKNRQLLGQIIAGYRENYITERPKLAEALVESYLKKINDPAESQLIKIYMLQVEGKVVAHCRFDGEKDEQVYFGSAFVTKYGRGKSIGGYFLTGALNAMGEEHRLHADCVPGEEISSYYVSKQGFVVDKIVEDYDKFNEPFIFHISREKTADIKKTHYQSISRGQIMKDYETNNFSEKDGRIILRYPIQKKVSLEMYPAEMKNRLTELINEKGYVMTGYFSVASNNSEKEKIVYCALELLDKSGTTSTVGDDASGESSENALE